jgi:hypothetical protein
MSDTTFQKCPRCGNSLKAGFAHKALGLSFVAPEKLRSFAFVDEELARAGWRRFLPSRAAYFRSYLCRCCELYIVDYSETLNRAQAKQAAETIISAKSQLATR